MRWLVVSLLLLACHDETDQCELPALCYTMELGPGTGDCDPEAAQLFAESFLVPFNLDDFEFCGPHVIATDTATSGCTAEYTIEAELTKQGPEGGTFSIDGNCGNFGAACEHSYNLEFTETDCASQ